MKLGRYHILKYLANNVSLSAAVDWSMSGGFQADWALHPLQLLGLPLPEQGYRQLHDEIKQY